MDWTPVLVHILHIGVLLLWLTSSQLIYTELWVWSLLCTPHLRPCAKSKQHSVNNWTHRQKYTMPAFLLLKMPKVKLAIHQQLSNYSSETGHLLEVRLNEQCTTERLD